MKNKKSRQVDFTETENYSLEKATKEFQIFKEGHTTDGNITILSFPEIPFNREAKILKFLAMGYQVFTMEGKEIKSIN